MLIGTMNSFCTCALFTVAFLSNVKFAIAVKCPSHSWAIDRIIPLPIPNETMAARIGRDPVSKSILIDVLTHFKTLGSEKMSGLYECHQRTGNLLLGNASAQLKHMGFTTLEDCIIILENRGLNGISESSSKSIFETFRSFSTTIESLARTSLPAYGLIWKNFFSPDFLSFSEPGKPKCEIAMLLGYRVNRTWGVAAILTNYSTEKVIHGNRRGYFTEVLSLDQMKNPKPLGFSLPICRKGNLTSFRKSTALLETWGGKPSWTHFAQTSLVENPALISALKLLEENKIAEEFVKHSESASNMAILVLPVALALVPLGLFQDVSLSITLVYTVGTDIFSVLPVAIKGIELLSGEALQRSTVSYFYGGMGEEKFAVAETWAAVCTQDVGYREKGIALLATAIAAMVVGITLEFVTRAQVSKYRELQCHDLDIPNRDQLPPYEGGGLLWHINRRAYEKRGENRH